MDNVVYADFRWNEDIAVSRRRVYNDNDNENDNEDDDDIIVRNSNSSSSSMSWYLTKEPTQ